ncbi:hypothetical protein [Isobaculum melis]|nr:hypothetical protein [Isobaculum melis]
MTTLTVKNNRKRNLNCLSYILIAFGLLGGELVLVAIEQAIYGADLSAFTLGQRLIHWSLTIVLWVAGCSYCYMTAKKEGIEPLRVIQPSLTAKTWFFIVVIVMISGLLSSYLWGWQFKPFVEFQGMMERHDSGGILAFIFQQMYYIAEGLVIVMIIAFGQTLGEQLIKGYVFPWGSIALGLTWGLGHLLSQDIVTALYCVIFSLFCGVLFLLIKKDAKLSLIVITLMFII